MKQFFLMDTLQFNYSHVLLKIQDKTPKDIANNGFHSQEATRNLQNNRTIRRKRRRECAVAAREVEAGASRRPWSRSGRRRSVCRSRRRSRRWKSMRTRSSKRRSRGWSSMSATSSERKRAEEEEGGGTRVEGDGAGEEVGSRAASEPVEVEAGGAPVEGDEQEKK
ncbi:hypothetical protein BaRGS_00017071 [Batillaria attramentaria]|uniref:Uncharacterized protein n=1 Tax=Batillaria attramentaria TaxID=370345 RepID=A0ABD0KWD8_9CAEN